MFELALRPKIRAEERSYADTRLARRGISLRGERNRLRGQSRLAARLERTYRPAGRRLRGPSLVRSLKLRVGLSGGLCRLGPTLQSRLLKDGWHLGIGQEVVVALFVQVEDHPDPIVLIGIAKHARTLGPVLLSLLSALG